MRKLIVALMITLLALGGCASQQTVDMAGSYNKAYETHQITEATKVQSKALAIQSALVMNCDESVPSCAVAKAFGGVLAAQSIAGIKSAKFNLEKHATDVDAQIKLVEAIKGGIPFATMGFVSYKAIDKDKGSVENNSNGGDIRNSYEETHTTAMKDSSAVSTKSDSSMEDDNSVKTEIPKEEEGMEEEVEEEVIE